MFNHAQLDARGSSRGEVNDPHSGEVVSAASPRLLQLAAKFTFSRSKSYVLSLISWIIGVTHVRKDRYTVLANDRFRRFGTEYLKTFVLVVNISACGPKDDYCGCVSAYCPGENAQA